MTREGGIIAEAHGLAEEFSLCLRRQVGAVIVYDGEILTAGVNGHPDCPDGACQRCAGTAPSGSSMDDCICTHAEQQAIAALARDTLATSVGATIYVTDRPCLPCLKLIASAGIVEVVYDRDYPAPYDTWPGLGLRRISA